MMHFGIQNSWKEHYNNVRWVTSPKPSHPLARWAPLNSWWAQYSHSEIIYMRCNQQNKTCMARLSLAIRLLASVGAPWNVSSSISSFSSTSINPDFCRNIYTTNFCGTFPPCSNFWCLYPFPSQSAPLFLFRLQPLSVCPNHAFLGMIEEKRLRSEKT